MNPQENRILSLLSRQFPDIASATTEIINLSAILQLPKGTEHFLSDLHGEYESFCHILKNASGVIRLKIEEIFEHLLTEEEKNGLATLIYYPEERLSHLKKEEALSEDWYRVTLYRLIEVCRGVAAKYTRSKVRKALPEAFLYIIEELLHEQKHSKEKDIYYRRILETIIRTHRADAFLVAISQLIQRLSVDHLHILGDIFDRGPGPHVILDTLIKYHSVDIAWGNHDVLWMGAGAGNLACIAAVIRISARYNTLETLENGYAIPLRQLFSFGEKTYGHRLSPSFFPVGEGDASKDREAIAALHQAITVIGLKLEGQLIQRHPEYKMEDRLFLKHRKGETLWIDGVSYPLDSSQFPTVDPDNPYKLSEEEEEVMLHLSQSFLKSQKLQSHIKYLFSQGGMYTVMNGNLMYHGCIPMEENGEFASFLGHRGKALLDFSEKMLRKGFFLPKNHPEKENCRDYFWYLWSGKYSPLFGKASMKTFERYYLSEKTLHREEKNPYYRLIEAPDSQSVAEKILREFSLDVKTAHIINGHVPVRQSRGESPVKAGGKLFMIDGGLSPAYREKTGIGGYTLIYHSHGYLLTAHEPYFKAIEAVEEQRDIFSHPVVTERTEQIVRVSDTDTGKELIQRIKELHHLVQAYRDGRLKER